MTARIKFDATTPPPPVRRRYVYRDGELVRVEVLTPQTVDALRAWADAPVARKAA